jgi:predicted GNAT superfamily acetyltransferase
MVSFERFVNHRCVPRGPVAAAAAGQRLPSVDVEPEIDIRVLHSADEMTAVSTVFQQVWGVVTPLVDASLLMAIAHSGGYVAGAYDRNNLVGASFGFLGRHEGELALHSHVTGILPGVQHSGVGRLVKEHQRGWAAEHDIDWITWTFDPLVRRNAWFNIGVLGVHVADYLVDFYGSMPDSINGTDATDRLLVAWPSDPEVQSPPPDPTTRTLLVATPDDIVTLRRTDPAEAVAWRHRLRHELTGALERGTVVDFTREGDYVVSVQG